MELPSATEASRLDQLIWGMGQVEMGWKLGLLAAFAVARRPEVGVLAFLGFLAWALAAGLAWGPLDKGARAFVLRYPTMVFVCGLHLAGGLLKRLVTAARMD